MAYAFAEIESTWNSHWEKNKIYQVKEDPSLPKYYVLDMFPYPSGAGLHVGHPLGYIASDIYARYKRLNGYNVLHPMGFDAFGLPAEQYAIETGRHPAETTAENIARYKEQLKRMGFNYDWSREVQTSDPQYYRWTQWIFLKLFAHWYNHQTQRAEPIESLIAEFERSGTANLQGNSGAATMFSAAEWQKFSEPEKQQCLLEYRLAYQADATVNWCEELGTVLANDEVKDGRSERGGHPVVKLKLKQWFLRITEYADRLLEGLSTVEWSDSLIEMQRNWIGRSEGAEVHFNIPGTAEHMTVFTTRPDTIFGATFMVLAPEHPLVDVVTTAAQQQEIDAYRDHVRKRSDIERQAEKTVSGAFTGAFAVNPLSGRKMPIWIAEYVLMGYGTGAIMAVPSDDERDALFAEKFGLEVIDVVEARKPDAAKGSKDGVMINSGFLNGLPVAQAIPKAIAEIEARGLGKRKINYRMRDAGFSRQRYWGEPFPIVYKNGLPEALEFSELPVELPRVQSYKPGQGADSPLAAERAWVELPDGRLRETDTMPGYAGSSWYFLRYMDPRNPNAFASPESLNYWKDVDIYIGGAEHAVGHLMYSRMWHKFLFDINLVPTDEPFKRLVNQGMIQGRSSKVYREVNSNHFISHGLIDGRDVQELHVDVKLVRNDILDIEAFKAWRSEFADATFELEHGEYRCAFEVEKMSKRWHNVVNPDDVIDEYGADAFRMYEMFLGPIEIHKPWDTSGIDGVSRFLRKLWRLFEDQNDVWLVHESPANRDELKTLHALIKKVTEDIERLSFNTAVSAFMVAVNEWTSMQCHKREVLVPLVSLLAPFAPYVSEELWHRLGQEGSVHHSQWPVWDEACLKEDSFEYPVSVNGKLRAKIPLPVDMGKADIERAVLDHDVIAKWLDGKPPRKVVVVPGRIVNVVI